MATATKWTAIAIVGVVAVRHGLDAHSAKGVRESWRRPCAKSTGNARAASGCVDEDFLWTGRAFTSLGRRRDDHPCPETG